MGNIVVSDRCPCINSNILIVVSCIWSFWIQIGLRWTLLVSGWTPFCLHNCLNSSRHWFNKVLGTLLGNSGPYWHDSTTQLLQICWSHVHDANLLFNYIPETLFGLSSGHICGHLSIVNSLSCLKTSWRWLEYCDVAHHTAGYQKMGTLWTYRDGCGHRQY